MKDDILLEAKNLKKHYTRPTVFFGKQHAVVPAVEDVSLTLDKEETLAIVGESGCGKSTTARMLLGLEQPTSGSVWFDGFDLCKTNRDQLRQYRSSVQAVFQDPWSSLNPRMRVSQIISEPLLINGRSKQSMKQAIEQSLRDVGLEQAAAQNFPHEFSGGQRQRIAIARAVALRPKAIVLDEPVSALDVSVRAQIMNLLQDLQRSLGMSYVLISHDLATVRFLANRVAVMYQGRIVEQANSESLFSAPLHPYTVALISAARMRRGKDERPAKKTIPIVTADSTGNNQQGCSFAPRCLQAFDRCKTESPLLRHIAGGHTVACHLH